MNDLILRVKRVYFEQIKAGTKPEEFRLQTPYWKTRIEGKQFNRVIVTLGYPRNDDQDKRIVLPWRGAKKKFIKHEHFGDGLKAVYAINVDIRNAP